MSESKKIIDVKKVIHEKNPKLLKFLPGFIVRYLQRILQEKDVNQFVHDHKKDTPIEFCLSVMKKFSINLDYEGLENVPEKGGAILAMNHPLGGMDAMALVTVVHEKRPDVKFVVNDVLMHLENLQPIFVGVNLHGGNAAASLKKVDETFQGDELLCIFPAGLVSRKTDGKIEDLKWKKTFVTRSIKYNKTIIPVHIDGELTNFFYNMYSIRKKLGVKANIEMLYLVNELYKQHNKKIKIKFGEPLYAADFDESKSHDEWAQYVKGKVYELKD
ncbi:glycerol acyltransferase [Brumimicrobium glaciale]|jgi:1-acyl-sn-glycerol-3-phosphate acyltransferase|uniref:Glycerol acyltransferase n=1 Tax=Brumimicrobium glaciale TaxID=200475 RepID=A0A4V1WEY8_9FLAO|nr:1-acyl-sn-glycerol-3-phosphate acyltransferase [Brumimicrobium glaciale]RYM31346.1 glycerol acyltransferase [Brumimicrobium glaciale]